MKTVIFLCNILTTTDSVSSRHLNSEKRVENTTRSGVFLTKFEVFFYLFPRAQQAKTRLLHPFILKQGF